MNPRTLKGSIGRHHPIRHWDVVLDFPRLEGELAYWLKHANRLTHEERQAILAGEISAVVRPIRPAWEEGDWLRVASGFDIVITAVKASPGLRRESYRTTYKQRDFRPNLMRRVVPVNAAPAFDVFGEPIPPTEAAIRAARIDGGYTQSAGLAVPDSAEEVDIDTQQKFAEVGLLNYEVVHASRIAKQEIRTVSKKLRRVQGEAARKGVDITPDLAAIKEQIKQLEARLKEAA